MKKILLLVLIGLASSCSSPEPSAQEIVDQAILASGIAAIKNATASFTFRKIQYEYFSKGGQFSYARIQTDSIGHQVKDVLANSGFARYINDSQVDISNEKRVAYTSSVNSVMYFAFLPLQLNDEAVNKSYEGIIEIKDKAYHKIKITFNQEGGGEDFEDVFYYWFDTDDYSMDYIAYSYNEEEGIGMRFRVAYNSRKINGVVIQDYQNLKPIEKNGILLSEIDQAYMEERLVELSLIELEDVIISIP